MVWGFQIRLTWQRPEHGRGRLRLKRPKGSSSHSDLGSLPGEMVLFLLLVALLSPTVEAGEWRSHPQRPSPTLHGQTCPDATLLHGLGLVHPSKKISELRETLIPSPLFKLWLHEHSGQAGIFLSGKIIGGHEAKPHSRPYSSRFQGNLTDVGVSLCVRTLCWQQLTAWEGEEQCPGPHPSAEPSQGTLLGAAGLYHQVTQEASQTLGREGQVNASCTWREGTDQTWNIRKPRLWPGAHSANVRNSCFP